MRPPDEISAVDFARPGGGATAYVAPCADTGRVEVIVHEGTTVILIINGENVKADEVRLSFDPKCPWAMADAFKALGMAARHAADTAERLAKVLKETYDKQYPFYNGNRAARRAGRYFFEYTDEARRRWPVPPRFMICKGRRKYK